MRIILNYNILINKICMYFKGNSGSVSSKNNRSPPSYRNRSPPSTRETSYLTNKPRIFSPFIPSFPGNEKAFEPDFLLDIGSHINENPIKKKPIIDMTIDIGGNVEKKVLIYEGEDSSSLARQFCIDNNLDLRCCSLISQEIEKQIMNYYEKKGLEAKKNNKKLIQNATHQRKKQKSLHNVDKNPKRKLTKNLSVKSFKEDLSSNSSEQELYIEKPAIIPKKYSKKKSNSKKEFHKLNEFPQNNKEEIYSFKPKINGPSSLFYENTDPKEKRYEKLYSKHMEKQKKKSKILDEFINETCTFHPEINESSTSQIRKGKGKDVGDRLHEFSQKWENNRKEREKFEQNYDLKTGQKLFQPVIKKDKYYERAKIRELKQDEIHIVTDENLLKTQKHSKSKSPLSQIQQKPTTTPKYNEKNQKVIKAPERILKKSSSEKRIVGIKAEDKPLKELFDSLDANKDGLISRNQLDFSKLDDELLEIIASLALEVFPAKQPVDFEGFISILEQQNVKSKILKVYLQKYLYNLYNRF